MERAFADSQVSLFKPLRVCAAWTRPKASKRGLGIGKEIRINEQRHICFRWSDGKAYDVEIVNYQ